MRRKLSDALRKEQASSRISFNFESKVLGMKYEVAEGIQARGEFTLCNESYMSEDIAACFKALICAGNDSVTSRL